MVGLFSSLVGLLSAHPALALVIVFCVAFGEALLIVGLFVPSTTVLVGAGTLIGVGSLPFWPVFLSTVAGSVAGDALSYWVGWRYNERIRQVWPFSKYPSVMAQGEAFFARHGGMSIFIVRFIPGAKAVVPAIAAMAGMPVLRFSLINVASAVLWSGVHILPAIALGRGIRVAHLADPRLMVLTATVAALLALVWYVTRLIYFLGLPRLDHWRYAVAARLSRRRSVWAQAGARVLENKDGLFVSFLLGVLVLLAVRGFIVLLGELLLAPGPLRSDQAISAFLQGMRDETVTHWMVAVTTLSDAAVLVPVTVLLTLLFALRRQWGVAAIVVVGAIAATGFAPMLAGVLHRLPPGGATETALFASGSAAQATVVYGLLALLLARAVRRGYRVAVYLATVLLVALIGVSRIYLLAHWPSDVLAAISFGTALVLIAAFLLHGRGLRVPKRGLAALVAVTVLVIVPVHLVGGLPAARARFAATVPVVEVTAADWIAGRGTEVPQARVLLDGDYGEPMILQSDRPSHVMEAALVAGGWRSIGTGQLDALLGAILPSSGGLAGHAAFPLTHVGRAPLATLVRDWPGRPGARVVLRLWDGGEVVIDGATRRRLVLGSVTGEEMERVMAGYGVLEPLDLNGAETAAVQSGVAAILGVSEGAAEGAVIVR